MTYTPEQIDEIIERYSVDNSRNTTDNLAKAAQQLRDENARLREALERVVLFNESDDIGNFHYMETSAFYEDLSELTSFIKQTLNQGGE